MNQISVTMSQYHWKSNPQPLYHPRHHSSTGVSAFCSCPDFLLKLRRLTIDQILRKRFFSKIVPAFRKYLTVSRWSLPGQCLISISAGHWVWQIDGHLPRRTFLSALLSLVISMTGRSKRSARALRHGADVVRGYRKLILRADLLYDDDDCFYYHSWRNNVVIAFGTLSSFHNIKI